MATLGEAPPTAAVPSRRAWPGPRGHWLFGCVKAIRRDSLGFYGDIWQTYGDYVRIPTLPGYDVYLIADPAAVEHVLVKNHKNYRKPEFLVGPMRQVVGNGLFTSDGDFWLRQRRLAQPAFLRGAVVRVAGPMSTEADRLIAEWKDAPDGRALDIVPEMLGAVLRIAGATLFGADIRAEADAIGAGQQAISAFVRHKINHPLSAPAWFPTPRNRAFRRAKALMDAVVLRVIEERRRRGIAANDLLDLLLAARDEESGTGMTDQQLKDEVLTLLFAGHDTTAAGLSWAWYLLAKHPDVQEHCTTRRRSTSRGARRRRTTCRTCRWRPPSSRKRCGCIRPRRDWRAKRLSRTKSRATRCRRRRSSCRCSR
jgi:cytochrome P450